MNEFINDIFNNDILLKEKENQEKQELINELLKRIKEEEIKNGDRKTI